MGLLEKKKDYVQRARDFHKKEDTIKRLKVNGLEISNTFYHLSGRYERVMRKKPAQPILHAPFAGKGRAAQSRRILLCDGKITY